MNLSKFRSAVILWLGLLASLTLHQSRVAATEDFDDLLATSQSRYISVSGDSRTGSIWIAESSGCTGDAIQIVLMIENNDISIDAFTADIQYDPEVLTYVDCIAGELDPGWTLFACNDLPPDVVRVAGFSVTGNIPAGSVGSLVIYNFTVSCPTCQDGDTSAIHLTRLLDDIADLIASDGTFTYDCGGATRTPTQTATQGPSRTPTPTLSPTNIPTLTSTPSPTGSIPPSATPTLTPSATMTSPSTTTPLPSPTRTPTPVHTEPPTITATPGIEILTIDLVISQPQPDCFTFGDFFDLSVTVSNPGGTRNADLYCVLDVLGYYYFYPTWTMDLQKETRNIDPGEDIIELLMFEWPEVDGYLQDLMFWAAFMDEDTFDLSSNVENVAFCYGN